MNKKILFSTIVGMLVFASCKKYEAFQDNPNNPTQADPSLLLPSIERTTFSTISADAALASRYLVYTQGASNTQYYGWQRSSMAYNNISQVIRMEQEAARTNKPNYRYIGKFLKSHFILNMTQTFGDIPYSQMMQSILNGNFSDSSAIRPAYDKQEDIYLGVLNDLKIAADSLDANGIAIGGDLIYNGNIEKWKRLINSYTLRVLMSLSKKENNTALNIKSRFNEIISNPAKYPLMTSNADNGRLPYYDITGNQYPYFNNNSMKTDYYLDVSFVTMLQDLKDPRLFVFGKPTPSSNGAVMDFDSYDGLSGSAPLAENTAKRGAGNASQINDRYAYTAINEPSLLFSYAELQFILAEAVVRNWISGDASTYYTNGIKASMEFSNYNNTYSEQLMNTYIASSEVALEAGREIEQIITQKYISMFMNTGWQPFYEQRRTGYPAFDVSGSGILNDGRIPKRWMYPNDEFVNNRVNVENAIKNQFPEGDDINGTMWIVQ